MRIDHGSPVAGSAPVNGAAPPKRTPTPTPAPTESAPPAWSVRPQPPTTPAAVPLPPRPAVGRVQIANLLIDMERVARVAPVVLFHPEEPYLPCSVEYLLAQGTLLDGAGAAIKDNPTQEDLADHAQDGSRVVINPSQYTGEAVDEHGRVRAPMYVSAQVGPGASFVDLHYIFLFAYNGPQTTRVRVPRKSFNCVLPHFAEHEGDIEGVTVRVTPDLSRILHVQVAGHGKPTRIMPNELALDGTHPIIRCAYNSHATYNGNDRAPVEWVVTTPYAALGFGVEFIDLTADIGPRWAPFTVDDHGHTHANGQLVFVGLDEAGKPLGNQPWASFRGKLGAHWTNDYTRAEGVGSSRLTPAQQMYTDALANTVVATGAAKSRADSDGTDGLGVRDFIHTHKDDDSSATF